MKANEILVIGNEIFSTNERKSIYKKEIFAECKTNKEKKNLRMKLRKKLDTFIAEFIASNKNAENSDDLIRILIMWFLFRGKINHKIQNAKYS